MLKVGLTGGIGCGKTTVSELFAELGVAVIDADLIARRLVQPGQPALRQIVAMWGKDMLESDGSLNRSRLRERVFSQPETKQALEALLHPLIFQAMRTEMAVLNDPYCLLAIPLLFETQMTALADRILVIDCPTQLQIERVRRRDQLSTGQIEAIIASQVSREYRLAHADDLIENTASNDKLAEDVKKLHNLYLSFSNCQD